MSRILLLFSTLFFVLTAYAFSFPELCQVSVPLTRTDVAHQKAALQTAFEQMLIKVTGDSTLPTKVAFSDLSKLTRDQYLQAYRYEAIPAVLRDLPGETPYVLSARFFPGAVKLLLQTHHIAIWGPERPNVLVWVLVEATGQSPDILADTSDTPLKAALNAAASHRGIALLFPEMDLTDMEAISDTTLENTDADAIVTASVRYHTDTTAAFVLKQLSDNHWQGKVTLLPTAGVAERSFDVTDTTAVSVFNQLVTDLTDTLAVDFQSVSEDASVETVSLVLHSVDSPRALSDATHYLSQMGPVVSLSAEGFTADSVTFDVSAKGGKQALTQAIRLDQRLLPEARTDDTLNYEWVG